MRTPFWTILGVVGLTVAGGCGEVAAPAGAPAPASGAVPGRTPRKPGYLTGRVTGADGKAIPVPWLKGTVSITGVAGRGERIDYVSTIQPDGTFSTRLADGIFREPYGSMKFQFDGKVFSYELVPTHAIDSNNESSEGIAQDFTWRFRGPTPRDEASLPTNLTHWFGASSTVRYENPTPRPDGTYKLLVVAPGTRFVFDCVPQGKLIDGSTAGPTRFERTWDETWGITPGSLHDLPPAAGGYLVTATEIAPGDVEIPLVIKMVAGKFARALLLPIESTTSIPAAAAEHLLVTRAKLD